MKSSDVDVLDRARIAQLAAHLRSLPHADAPAQDAMGDYAKQTDCGTVCCIAGETVLVFGTELERSRLTTGAHTWSSVQSVACRLLGLPLDEGVTLFHSTEWSAKEKEAYCAARTLGEERELMARKLEALL